MEKEISISNIHARFNLFAADARRLYGAVCQLAEIRGSRWSFAAGEKGGDMPACLPEKIRLNEHSGIIVYGWDKLPGTVRQEIRSFLSPASGISREDIIRYLKTEDSVEIEGLFRAADSVRKEHVGDEVHLRGIIEFSNTCLKDCLYCGLRRSNAARRRYRMSAEEIHTAARDAASLGYRTVVLQSGEDRSYGIDELCGIVSRVKKELGLAITLSAGEFAYDDYKRLLEAGVDRYLMRFETSDPELFKKLKPDSDRAKRMEILHWLGEIGFQVGSGIMIGLPGQTVETIADDILLFSELGLEMIGNGPFIPNLETPLGGEKGGTLTQALKIVALSRLAVPRAHIPATTALGTIDPEGRQKALKCGANVIMPNVTPLRYRKDYLLYPGKICVNDRPEDCKSCIEAMLVSMGRKIAADQGHGYKHRGVR